MKESCQYCGFWRYQKTKSQGLCRCEQSPNFNMLTGAGNSCICFSVSGLDDMFRSITLESLIVSKGGENQ